jgi:adenylosuccinate synthase
MTMQAIAVIGANFGDEGKGLLTDFLSTREIGPALVVRFNGGAQAGHTVVTPEGSRHIFHHFGSGTLAGKATYLSEHFIVNPFLWSKEYDELSVFGVDRKMYVHPDALVTTYLDMLVNQEVEAQRANRHGSCGVGINETMIRDGKGPRIRVRDLNDPARLRQILDDIRDISKSDTYLRQRLTELGIKNPSSLFYERACSEMIKESFIECARAFVDSNQIIGDEIFSEVKGTAIFEGAQGLLLDQDYLEFFPHLTHSKTGLHNICEIARRLNFSIRPIYVTRTYMTRHGRGPFPSEAPDLKFDDETNVPNPWQETLRFGNLDLKRMEKTIRADLANARGVQIESPSLAVTHLDQSPVPDSLSDILPIRYLSNGPRRDQVSEDRI